MEGNPAPLEVVSFFIPFSTRLSCTIQTVYLALGFLNHQSPVSYGPWMPLDFVIFYQDAVASLVTLIVDSGRGATRLEGTGVKGSWLGVGYTWRSWRMRPPT